MKKIFFSLILISLVACGGRVPSPKSAQSLTEHFFNRYSKKYKTSIFGENKIKEVKINGVQEQALNLATIDAFLTLDNGTLARVLINSKKQPPVGWKVQSWEMMDLR